MARVFGWMGICGIVLIAETPSGVVPGCFPGPDEADKQISENGGKDMSGEINISCKSCKVESGIECNPSDRSYYQGSCEDRKKDWWDLKRQEKRQKEFMKDVLTGSDQAPGVFDVFPQLQDYNVPDDLVFDLINWSISQVVTDPTIPDNNGADDTFQGV